VTITGWELAIVMAVCLCVGAALGVVFMALIVAGRDGGPGGIDALTAENERLTQELLSLRLAHRDLIRCEGCGQVVDADEAENWERTVDGCDLCLKCWHELVTDAGDSRWTAREGE
jgi:hypothetical protein